MENFSFFVGGENEDAVVAADCPVLTFDGDPGFCGEFVEGVCAVGGVLDVGGAFIGEGEE